MAEQTGISWADATFNPWMGCQKVSPACDHCYAEELCTTRMKVGWGPHGERRRTAASTWKKIGAWNRRPEKLNPPPLTKPFVFGGSLCDVFDNRVDIAWLREYLEEIEAAPNLVFLLLTKRPQLIISRSRKAGFERLPANVALGTTCEDQTRADQNLPHLLAAANELRALFVFASFEPLLGPVEASWAMEPPPGLIGLEWVITGGESGRHARPADPDWFRSLRDQTLQAGAIYHHKQNGSRGPDKGGKLLDGALHQGRPLVVA